MTICLRLDNVKREIVNELKNADLLTVTQRNVTTTTQNFTATASQTVFTLTYEPRNIRSLTVAAVNKYYFLDYEFNAVNKTVTLYTGATLSDAVIIQYDYGTTGAGGDKIYPDYPREDLSFKSYPRIAVEITNQNTEPLGLGASKWISDIVITVFAWVPAERISNIGGSDYLSYLTTKIREALINRAKSFYLFKFIKPLSTTGIIKGPYDKVLQQNQDFMIQFVIE